MQSPPSRTSLLVREDGLYKCSHDFNRWHSIKFGFRSLILEVAILDVKTGLTDEFEAAFKVASKIIMVMPGYLSHELQRCLENHDRYILLVRWQKLEDHTVGFRRSPEYQEWRSLLHHFYEPFPIVEHYEMVLNSSEYSERS